MCRACKHQRPPSKAFLDRERQPGWSCQCRHRPPRSTWLSARRRDHRGGGAPRRSRDRAPPARSRPNPSQADCTERRTTGRCPTEGPALCCRVAIRATAVAVCDRVGVENVIRLPWSGLSWNGPGRRNSAMALSFLYLAFIRILQLVRPGPARRGRVGDRGSHAPSRGGGTPSPGGPAGLGASGSSAIRRVESTHGPKASRCSPGSGRQSLSTSMNPRPSSSGKAKTPGANVWPPRLRFRPRQ